jgi:hypothetical protein
MTTMIVSTAPDLLVKLDRLGVHVALKGDRISLQPASLIPPDLLVVIRECKTDVAALLTEPRRRWRAQAQALLAPVTAPALCEDLLHLFDEREAIASVDGNLNDDLAGELAYRELVPMVVAFIEKNLSSQGPQTNGHQYAGGNDGSAHQKIA